MKLVHDMSSLSLSRYFPRSSSTRARACCYLLIAVVSLWTGSPSALATPQDNANKSPEQTTATLTGMIVDVSGTTVAAAQMRLTFAGLMPARETVSDDDGRFSFSAVPPGAFQLTIVAEGFATRVMDGAVQAGETQALPVIQLVVASAREEVTVSVSSTEIAEDQIKAEEKQRVLGVIPNFYVSYVANAEPLAPKQKFELAWKSLVDPVNFAVTGVIAGIEQSQNQFGGFGQGTQGYAKRYGATYADFVSGTMIGGAILPSLLKQDPRYFYKGSGSKRSRVLYALANAVICKGDNGHWQANYSAILGGLAAGGLSNLYYPEKDRNGAQLTFENTLIGIGSTAAVNIIQEFILKRFTPNLPNSSQQSPQP